MGNLFWLVVGVAGGVLSASFIWIATGWLYKHQPGWLGRYMAWLNRKAGFDWHSECEEFGCHEQETDQT